MSPDGVVEENEPSRPSERAEVLYLACHSYNATFAKNMIDGSFAELESRNSDLQAEIKKLELILSNNNDVLMSDLKKSSAEISNLRAEILKLKEINANVDGLQDVISDLQKKLEVAVRWIENLKKSHNPQEGEYHFAICDCIVCQRATEALAKLKEKP